MKTKRKSTKRKKLGRPPKKARLADFPFSAPEDATPEMKAIFDAAMPVRNAILSGVVKSDGETFVTKAALLHLVSHVSIHLVKIRALENEVIGLHKKLADIQAERDEELRKKDEETKDWVRSIGRTMDGPASEESQSETDLEMDLVSDSDLDASTRPSAP